MQEIAITLDKLGLWKGNVRRTAAGDGIDELAASIAAHGLLQPLVVRKGKRDRFEIIAGQRRYLALSALAKEGRIEVAAAIPCRLAETGADATEISLAENVVRTQMHPADQFDAFRALIDKGATPAQIAARFGVSELTIAKRLKLARVAPALLDDYRAGSMSLEQVMAFTLSDDHDRQVQVWQEAKGTCRAAPTNCAGC